MDHRSASRPPVTSNHLLIASLSIAVTASARTSAEGVTEALTFFQAENELDYLLALLATGKQPKSGETEGKAHGKGKTYIVFMDGPTSTSPLLQAG